MKEFLPKNEVSTDKKFWYLRPDIKPIMVCLGDAEAPAIDIDYSAVLINADFVDLYGNEEILRQKNYIKEGDEEYVISPVNFNNKLSKNFCDCTGAVTVGLDKKSGLNISFMSHQNPDYFLEIKREQFVLDFESRLTEIKDRCESGTIETVLFGGRYAKVRQYEDGHPDRDAFIQEYVDSINLLTNSVCKELGFYPEVIVGPKFSSASDTVAFDTKNRRLYLTRHNKKDFVKSFNSKNLSTVAENWKPGEWSLPI